MSANNPYGLFRLYLDDLIKREALVQFRLHGSPRAVQGYVLSYDEHLNIRIVDAFFGLETTYSFVYDRYKGDLTISAFQLEYMVEAYLA